MTAEIKIEKDIPVPDRASENGRGRRGKYPFSQMEIGDSFFLPRSPKEASTTVSAAKKKLGFKFYHEASVAEEGTEGTRVWRVA